MWDLIVTMDDATSEIYSAFFVEEEGTLSSFQGVRDTLLKKGLFSSFYSDRGSHYAKADNSLAIKTGQIYLLTTAVFRAIALKKYP